LRDAVIRSGRAADQVHIILDELEAARTAVDMADKADLAVLMVDKPAEVWNMLTSGAKAEEKAL
ncbi:MAG TPA: hypothetical protein VM450_06965, partial [Thermomicrobiales bacterium]|nr:hypothetical protein [Thermomicrobiales bacterium]